MITDDVRHLRLTLSKLVSSWAHNKGVPGKVTAELMGHANVYTTLNTYTQVLDDSLRVAAEKIGEELFRTRGTTVP
jgi:integrase